MILVRRSFSWMADLRSWARYWSSGSSWSFSGDERSDRFVLLLFGVMPKLLNAWVLLRLAGLRKSWGVNPGPNDIGPKACARVKSGIKFVVRVGFCGKNSKFLVGVPWFVSS